MKAFISKWWPLILVSLWAILSLTVSPTSPMNAMAVPGLSAAVVLTLLVISLALALIRRSGRRKLVILGASITICALVGAVHVSGGPVRLRFLASRAELHDQAMLAVQGRPATTPVRIGMFDVTQIEIDGGVVRFRTYEDELGDQGLAYFPIELTEPETDSITHVPLGWERGAWYLYARDVDGT